jgi:FHA domain
MDNATLNKALLSFRISARAGSTDHADFLPVPGLSSGIELAESQVIFGRHGTGKTHLLVDLQRRGEANGALTAFVDLRGVGEVSDLYGGLELSELPSVATRLAVDVLEEVHRAVREQVTEREEMDPSTADSLDRLAGAITQVRVSGVQEQSETVEKERGESSDRKIWAALTPTGPTIGASGARDDLNRERSATVIVQQGHADVWLHLGSVTDAISSLAKSGPDLLVLLDQWNSVPLQLQPYLADLLWRLLWGRSGCALKIAAVEGESKFLTKLEAGLVGINQHDVSSISMDDLAPSGEEMKAFIEELLFEHAKKSSLIGRDDGFPDDAQTFCSMAFEAAALELLIEVSEGIPRDALIVARTAAREAGAAPISVNDVTRATYDLLYEHKDGSATDSDFVSWLTQRVVRPGKSRCFNVDKGSGRLPRALRPMYEARLLHRRHADRKSGEISDWGQMFDEWRIDYAYTLHLLGGSDPPLGSDAVPPASEYDKSDVGPIFKRDYWHRTSTFSALGTQLPGPEDDVPSSWVRAEMESLPESGTFFIIDSGERVWSVPLDTSPMEIGRSDCDINIDHPTVSRHHATLSQNGDTWRIVDSGSTNGVVVRQMRREWHELVPDDVVWLGFMRAYFIQRGLSLE